MHYEPESLLWDLQLREVVFPAECMTWDLMHCLLSGGLVDTELTLSIPLFVAGGLSWADMAAVFDAD